MRFKNETFSVRGERGEKLNEFAVASLKRDEGNEQSVEFILLVAYGDKRRASATHCRIRGAFRITRVSHVSRASKGCGARS